MSEHSPRYGDEPTEDDPLTDAELEVAADLIAADLEGKAETPELARRIVAEVRRLQCELHDAKMEAAFWARHGTDCPHCLGRCGREHPEAPPR